MESPLQPATVTATAMRKMKVEVEAKMAEIRADGLTLTMPSPLLACRSQPPLPREKMAAANQL